MSTEHVVTTRAKFVEAQSSSLGHVPSLNKDCAEVTSISGCARQVVAGYWQPCDEHGGTSQQKHSPKQGTESPQYYSPVFVKEQDAHQYSRQEYDNALTHLKAPRDVGYVVQEDVRQWRVLFLVWHEIVDEDSHDSPDDNDQPHI